MALFLSFRYSTVGGATRKDPVAWISNAAFALTEIKPADIAMLTAGRDVLFATHGFNVPQANGVCALSRLEQQLKLPMSAQMIGVLWPGDSHAGGASYPTEKKTASDCGRYLAAFCKAKLAGAATISFLSHSLGARLVLEAVRRLDRRARSVCLTAGAIERDCLTKEYADAFANADVVSILASREDEVLRFLFPLGNLVAHVLNPTVNPLSSALGYAGPPAPLGKTVRPWDIPKDAEIDHGDYLPPSDPTVPFPDDKGVWNEPSGFMQRAFAGQLQTWPP